MSQNSLTQHPIRVHKDMVIHQVMNLILMGQAVQINPIEKNRQHGRNC